MKRAAVPSILVAVVLLALGVTADAAADEESSTDRRFCFRQASGAPQRSRHFDKGYANLGAWRRQNITLEPRCARVISNASQVSLRSLSALRRT